MTLQLGMQHCLCMYYQGYSNYDPGLTLTYFTPRLNLVIQAFVFEKVKIIIFSKLLQSLVSELLEAFN